MKSTSLSSPSQPRLSLADNATPQRGIGLMMIAMMLIPGVDVLAKLLSSALSPVQITFLRLGFQSLFLLIALRALPPLRHSLGTTAQLWLCSFFIVAAIISMVWGLSYLPVANAVALFFIEPLLVMLLSTVLLNERPRRIKYLLALVGLGGAMVVIRPNWQLYGWPAVLPMLAALFYALYLISIRATRDTLPPVQAQSYISLVGTLMLGLGLLLGTFTEHSLLAWGTIETEHYSLILLLGLVSALCHWLISTAFVLAPASVVAPFRYMEILSAVGLGYLIFNEMPDPLTWLGMAIILAAGLAILQLERREHR